MVPFPEGVDPESRGWASLAQKNFTKTLIVMAC